MSYPVSTAPSSIESSKARFSHSADTLRDIAQDMLDYAEQRGATAASAEVSEGFGQSVTVRHGEVELSFYRGNVRPYRMSA